MQIPGSRETAQSWINYNFMRSLNNKGNVCKEGGIMLDLNNNKIEFEIWKF